MLLKIFNGNIFLVVEFESLRSFYRDCSLFLANKNNLIMLYTNIYINSLLNKAKVLKENKDKIGIYRWVNKITKESYVGSSTNITKRLRKYYCINYLNSRLSVYNSRIYEALLNYGYSNFNLEILRYCDKNSLIHWEQYYINKLKPEYNICKTAGSMLDFKHSSETKLKFKNRTSVTAHLTVLINIENKSRKEYSSIRSAAKDIGISHTTLLRYILKNKIVNNTFKVNRFKP